MAPLVSVNRKNPILTHDPALGMKARTYVTTQTELAEVLGCDRTTIQRHLRRPGNPGRTSGGKYNLKKWRDWMEVAKGLPPSADEQIIELKRDQAILKNRLLAMKNRKQAGELIPVEEVEQAVSEAVLAAKARLYEMPASLAPQVVGVSEREAAERIRESIDEALALLAPRFGIK